MSRLSQINRFKHVFDKRTFLIIINSLVFSKLFYCSNLWANTAKCTINKLRALQTNMSCTDAYDNRAIYTGENKTCLM